MTDSSIMSYIRELFFHPRLVKARVKWRRKNKHNYTVLGRFVEQELIHVGNETYGYINVIAYDGYNNNLEHKKPELYIGNYCSLSGSCLFMLGGIHDLFHISTYPFKNALLQLGESSASKDTIVEDDVWIGEGATIMSGVKIGQGAVIGANALVTEDIPPYAIVAGIPAKIIRYRFKEELIHEFLKVDYSKLTMELAKKHLEELYTPIESDEQLHWLPKKSKELQ